MTARTNALSGCKLESEAWLSAASFSSRTLHSKIFDLPTSRMPQLRGTPSQPATGRLPDWVNLLSSGVPD